MLSLLYSMLVMFFIIVVPSLISFKLGRMYEREKNQM
jgi:hypothetical protein